MIINQRLLSPSPQYRYILHGRLVIFCFIMESFYCMQEASGILCSPLLFAAHIQMANLLSARSLTDKRKGRKTAHMVAHAHTHFSYSRPKNQRDTHLIAVLLNASAVEGRHMSSLKVDRLGRLFFLNF